MCQDSLMGIYRVFLAVAVIGFHVGLPFMGPLAIYMFYIFSGYLIHYLLEKYSSETKRFVKKFISSRVIKLFPSYFFVIIFLYLNNFLLKKLFNEVLYLNLDFSISDFSQIIQSFFPIISINLYEPYLILDSKSVPVFWTVFNEIIFYTIFILVFLISKKTKINFIKLFYVISLS